MKNDEPFKRPYRDKVITKEREEIVFIKGLVPS